MKSCTFATGFSAFRVSGADTDCWRSKNSKRKRQSLLTPGGVTIFAMSKGKNQRQNRNKITTIKNFTIMKRIKLFFAAIICLFTVNTICMAHDRQIPPEQLPAAAKTFIQKHFPGKTITKAEIDTEFMRTRYEVDLNDGTEINFNKDGSFDKVDCHTAPVPAAIIPAAIQKYVKTNFPGAMIVKIDKERYGYEIELSNNLDLKFNNKGAFLGCDD